MYRFITFCLFCGMLSFSASAQMKVAVISGKTSEKNQSVVLLNDNSVRKIIHSDKQGMFRDTIQFSKNFVSYETQPKNINLALRDKTELFVDFTQKTENVREIVSGNDTDLTYFFADKKAFFNEKYYANNSKLFRKKPQQFKAELNQIFSDWKIHSKKILPDSNEITPQDEERWADEVFTYLLITYPVYNKSLTKSAKDIKLPNDFFAELNAIDLDNAEDYKNRKSYKTLVMMQLKRYMTNPNDTKQTQKLIEITENIKSENIKKDYQEEILDLLEVDNPNNLLIYNYLNEKAITADLRKRASEIYNKIEKTPKKGEKSPSFTFENEKGEKVSLEDFRGKVVYIDVWASWCAPCLTEIPHLKELVKDFKNKDIVFISISQDINKERWKSALKEQDLSGIQLFADRNDPFFKAYYVDAIPHFILIDKEGNVLEANALEPSEPELKNILKKVLK